MVDFTANILSKASFLISRAQQLPEVKVEWHKPVTINCCHIDQIKNGETNELLLTLVNNKARPALYYFKFVESCNVSQVRNAINEFKKQRTRSCPKIDLKRSLDSHYLYCGSVKKNLHSRFIQHLGKGHPKTYALHLAFWATSIDLQLEYHYGWINNEFVDFTELLESALAEKIRPLVGKLA